MLQGQIVKTYCLGIYTDAQIISPEALILYEYFLFKKPTQSDIYNTENNYLKL